MKNIKLTKSAQRMLAVGALAVASVVPALADGAAVPTVDYTGVVTGASTYVGSLLTTNAPGIILIGVAFSGFAWLANMIRKRTAGK